jgi:hypothetical protein
VSLIIKKTSSDTTNSTGRVDNRRRARKEIIEKVESEAGKAASPRASGVVPQRDRALARARRPR